MDAIIFFFRNAMGDSITLQTILRCFETTFGLKVYFHKSNLVGINVDQREVNTCAIVLNCNIMSIPFICLGLSIEVDARKCSTRQPIIEKMQKKLTP